MGSEMWHLNQREFESLVKLYTGKYLFSNEYVSKLLKYIYIYLYILSQPK